MRNILDHTSHPRKTNANPSTDERYPPCINFSRETQGQAFDLLEQLEERVNLVPTVPYCVRGVALASIDRAGTTTVWRPRPSGGAFHDSLGGGTEFIGYADAAVLHPRGFTPFSPSGGDSTPRGVESVAGGATYCVWSQKREPRTNGRRAKKTFSGVRSNPSPSPML